ncbi:MULTISPECIES: carbohydrate porin [Pseudomonas]|uniref:carbohydrate porin n=1 Tax=Pseudomonas guariconensis TaxID=1288410 RepID=UPI0020980846|nr:MULTISPECIES: carbohydrate porin [Pseudomonas]MCO7597474.1 carbohydrate porin [Pseudomonas guariconensis]MCU7223216.1 carbohydrate porin [Pseudomonas brassicacearum]
MEHVIAHSSFVSANTGKQKSNSRAFITTRKSWQHFGLCIIIYLLISVLLVGPNAQAAEAQPTDNTKLIEPSADAAKAEASDNAPPPDTPSCLKYDRYNYKGSEAPFPSNCESISPELGGARKAMFDAGWNAQLLLTHGLTYDLKGHDGGKQYYSGQKPSYTATGSLIVTHDLERHGLPAGSLFTLGGSFNYNSFRGDGLREAFISQLSARVPLYDDRLIIQAGYYALANQFYGTLLGNNIAASTLGPSSGLLAQVGALGFKPSPAVDVRLYSEDKRFYYHGGLARSISPDGLFADADENRYGLKFKTKGAKTIALNEVGYRVESGPNQRKVWLRGGVAYNDSDYTRLDDPSKTNNNYGAYVVGDIQLTQPDSSLPYKGWYMNAYVNQGRENVNYLPGAFGGSIYSLGPFDSRPYDLFALGVSKNQYSSWARRSAADADIDYAKASSSISLSYAYRVSQGVYVQSALIHTDNPTFAPKLDSSLNANVTLVLVF